MIPFSNIPLEWKNPAEHRRKLATALRSVLDGAHNATGSVTLRASQTTTTIDNRRIGIDTKVFLMPTTSNAAAAVTSVYQSANDEFEITLTHDSDAATDRIFYYVLSG